MISLNQTFLRLPKRYCAETLAKEVSDLGPDAWVPHPSNFRGNDAVLLVTPQGQMTNGFAGPMAPTPLLQKCPYIMEIMADLDAVWGRSRLMGLAAGAEVPPHVDIHYHWRTHLRIHIPVITNPDVIFTCGSDSVHMEPGECWVFDSFQMHNVRNGGAEKRIHLVLDTVGGERLWDLVAEAEELAERGEQRAETLLPGQKQAGELAYEQINLPEVMSPWELRNHIDYLCDHVVPSPLLDPISRKLDRFACGWMGAWAQFGPSPEGGDTYRALIADLRRELDTLAAGNLRLRNGVPLGRALDEMIFRVAVPASPQPQGAMPSGFAQRRAS